MKVGFAHIEIIILTAQFGKTIQQQQLPGWAPYYINYKALKKVISSLGKQSQKSNLSTIPLQQSPTEDSDESAQYLRSEKATFFFKLERELEKVESTNTRNTG